MAQVAFRAAGAGAENNTSTTLAVPFPASVVANELLVLVLGAGIHATGFQQPTGFTRHPGVPADVDVGTVATIGAECISVWYKWAAGTESGNLTCSRTTGTDHFVGRMFAYNGFTSTGSDPFVGSATNSGTDASMESPATAAAATADNDMGLLICVRADDDSVLGNWDEGSPPEWTESVAEFLATSGNDASITVNHCDTITSGNVIPANLETASAADPWWILTCIVKEAAGAVAYSLDCQPGSFGVTGVAATLAAGRVFNAAAGSYAVTGAAATTARGLFLTASPGAYTVTGTAASTVAGRVFTASPGSYAVTGAAATLAAGRVFSADPGTYTITGVATTLGAETPGVYEMAADPGSYNVTGTAATPIATRVLSASPASYAVTGASATVGRTLTIVADPGVYTLTGANASFLRTLVLSASTGAYSVTGAAADLRTEGQAPNLDEILTGWIAGANGGGIIAGGGANGRIRQPVTGGIA